MRAIVAGGGTGGHIYPALAIAEALRRDGAEILYLGVADSMEDMLAREHGFSFAAVPAHAMHRSPGKLMLDLAVNLQGTVRAKRLLKEFHPQVVIGTGGYSSAPAVKAAQSLHIPTLLHEQNAFPGKANRYLARKADAVCLTFDAAAPYFPHRDRLHLTGLPVRSQILETGREESRSFLSIPEDVPVLLITGGSQGASSMNRAAAGSAEALLDAGWWVIHICGKDSYDEMKQQVPNSDRWLLYPFVDHMEHPLHAADVAFARAGASFLAEAAAIGLPLILTPYPYAANDHQRYNARAFVDAGAARVIEDGELNGDRLFEAVETLRSEVLLPKMKENMLRLGQPNAVENILGIIKTLIK